MKTKAQQRHEQFKYFFFLGNIEVSARNINELKEFVCEIADKLAPGEEHSKYISDFIYSVESQYQMHHRLDPDNWDMVHQNVAK